MSTLPQKMIIISGWGAYPRLIVEGAHAAGVRQVDVLAVRGSTDRATVKAADNVHTINLGGIAAGLKWVAAQGYDGACFAGQINPLSLFTARFDAETKGWLDSLSVKNAHTVYGKLAYEFEAAGVKVFPASSFMDGYLPGVGALTVRSLTDREASDVAHGATVVRDMGRHDVGQTVLVKEGMVLAVEAFEGTNAAIKRGGKLGGKGAVVVKGAREGHDMRFDIPVVGRKTLKVMRKAHCTALCVQAGRTLFIDLPAVVREADRLGIAIRAFDSGLPPAPRLPLHPPPPAPQ